MDSQTINVLLTTILTLSTVIYVILTNFLVRESRKTRQFQETPFIVASISFSGLDRSVIILNIKNIGLGYAKNVSFNIIKDYEWVENMPLKERGAFKNGISSFPPNYELNFIIAILSDGKRNEILDKNFIEFEIFYENQINKKFRNNYKLHFNEIISQGYSRPPSNNNELIAYYLKEISENLKQINIPEKLKHRR